MLTSASIILNKNLKNETRTINGHVVLEDSRVSMQRIKFKFKGSHTVYHSSIKLAEVFVTVKVLATIMGNV